jgi:CRP-like cAMP-binding protein
LPTRSTANALGSFASYWLQVIFILGGEIDGQNALAMNNDFEIVRRVLLDVSPLSDAAILPIMVHVRRSELNAGEFLLRAGDRATHTFIVVMGLLREFHLDREGRQATRGFSPAGALSGSLADLLSGAPAISHIEALEPSTVLSIPWLEINQAATTDQQWQLLLRRVAERLYVQKVHREHAMLTLTAAQRLELLRKTSPDLMDRVPKHAIASYLGITPVHLSRLLSASR